ncbi:MAG: YdeI/OmpD-associated family protein [Bacteroidia bacterium]
MTSFSSLILKIGINPYVKVPSKVLNELFFQAGKSKGPIPVKGKLNGKPFIQHVVKYKGVWRLYLNTPMRKAAGIDVGDMAYVEIDFDNTPRIIPIHSKLADTLSKNKKAKETFEKLAPYRQKEIIRYVNSLKTEESVNRNIIKIMEHLTGKQSFAGRT